MLMTNANGNRRIATTIVALCMVWLGFAVDTAGGPVAASPGSLSPAETFTDSGIGMADVFPRGLPETRYPHSLLHWLAPSDKLLLQGQPEPPSPLWTESFRAVSTSAIKPAWLPDKLDDPAYMEIGEGAYRALTARVCKIYHRNETRVVLQRFAHGLVLIVKPLPVEFPSEATAAIEEAANWTERSGTYPYMDSGTPQAVEWLFRSIADEVLAPAAHPTSQAEWARCVKVVNVWRGGLFLSYLCSAEDPAGDQEPTTNIWTNGNVLVISVYTVGIPARSKLFQTLQPTVSFDAELAPAVAEVLTNNEWGDAERGIVPTREEATHQWFYIRLMEPQDAVFQAWIELANVKAQLAVAQWCSLAMQALEDVQSATYDPRYTVYQLNQALEGQTRSEVLAWLEKRRSACVDGVESLRGYACPDELAPVREKVLDAAEPAVAVWDMAWPRWEAALTRSEAVDYNAVGAEIRKNIYERYPDASAGVMATGWGLIQQALEKMGIRVDRDLYSVFAPPVSTQSPPATAVPSTTPVRTTASRGDDASGTLAQIPAETAVSRIAEVSPWPIVAWLDNPEMLVSWEEGLTAQEALTRLGVSAPTVYEHKDGVLVATIMSSLQERAESASLPGHGLVRVRQFIESLPLDTRARLARGEHVAGPELPPLSAEYLRTFMRESISGLELFVDCVSALKHGTLQICFRPDLHLHTTDGRIKPGDWLMSVSTKGEPDTEVEWATAASYWAESRTRKPGIVPWRLPEDQIALPPGLYTLRELSERVTKDTGMSLGVDQEYADHVVYLRVPAMRADNLLRLVADACNLQVLEAEGRVFIGSAIEDGDLLRLHERNLAWFLDYVKPLTGVPLDSMAGQLAHAGLVSASRELSDVPSPWREYLATRLPQSGEGCRLRLLPTFGLCFCGPIGTVEVGFK